MGPLRGFMLPRSSTGRASLVPAPPWHYSGDLLTIEYRTDPERVIELLPEPLEPAPDPGAVAIVFADWQSCSDGNQELLDPVTSQYKEAFFVVRCTYRGELYSRCVYIWVDKDFSLLRGHHQGYPKKLGDIWMTRPVTIGKAGPRLAVGGQFGATVSANGRRLVEAEFTIDSPSDDAGFVNASPMIHHRWVRAIESRSDEDKDSLSELVTMRGVDLELSDAWRGRASVQLFASPTEELMALEPREMIAGYWRSVGVSWDGGTTLES